MIDHALGAMVCPGSLKGDQPARGYPDGRRFVRPNSACSCTPGKNKAEVFQLHGDAFDLPAGVERLASSGLYPNQAFRYRDRVYAPQFHIEVTPAIARD